MLERRTATRVEINVEMEVRKNGDVFLGTSVNVSEAGILIQTNKVLQLGDKVTIRLTAQGQPEIVGLGEVVRNEDLGFDKLGYAVRWELSEDQKGQSVLDGLKALAPLAEKAGVTLVLEPLNNLVDHAGYWLKYADVGFELVREINSPNIRLLFDIYHQQVTEGNLIQRLTSHLDLIGHVHIADVPGRHQPGSGEINYPVVLGKLREAGYTGYVGCEFEPTISSEQAAASALKLIKG